MIKIIIFTMSQCLVMQLVALQVLSRPIDPKFIAASSGESRIMSDNSTSSKNTRRENMLKEGQKFPQFKLKNQDGKDVSLKDFAGKWLVVYFYPKDDTPGCTIQGKSFTATKEEFEKAKITVLGVSQDDVASHKDFCNKFAFKIDLLADTEKQLLKETGIGQSEYKGNMYWDRTTFVINPEGTIVKVYQKVSPDGHEQILLKDIKELQKAAHPVH